VVDHITSALDVLVHLGSVTCLLNRTIFRSKALVGRILCPSSLAIWTGAVLIDAFIMRLSLIVREWRGIESGIEGSKMGVVVTR
jgi:hypothetical protein